MTYSELCQRPGEMRKQAQNFFPLAGLAPDIGKPASGKPSGLKTDLSNAWSGAKDFLRQHRKAVPYASGIAGALLSQLLAGRDASPLARILLGLTGYAAGHLGGYALNNYLNPEPKSPVKTARLNKTAYLNLMGLGIAPIQKTGDYKEKYPFWQKALLGAVGLHIGGPIGAYLGWKYGPRLFHKPRIEQPNSPAGPNRTAVNQALAGWNEYIPNSPAGPNRTAVNQALPGWNEYIPNSQTNSYRSALNMENRSPAKSPALIGWNEYIPNSRTEPYRSAWNMANRGPAS